MDKDDWKIVFWLVSYGVCMAIVGFVLGLEVH